MILAVVIIIIGDLAIAESMRRCATGRIGVNQMVGLRTATIMATDETWQAAHRAALPWTYRGVAVSIPLALIAAFMPSEGLQAGFIIAAAVALLIGILVGASVGTRTAREILAR